MRRRTKCYFSTKCWSWYWVTTPDSTFWRTSDFKKGRSAACAALLSLSLCWLSASADSLFWTDSRCWLSLLCVFLCVCESVCGVLLKSKLLLRDGRWWVNGWTNERTNEKKRGKRGAAHNLFLSLSHFLVQWVYYHNNRHTSMSTPVFCLDLTTDNVEIVGTKRAASTPLPSSDQVANKRTAITTPHSRSDLLSPSTVADGPRSNPRPAAPALAPDYAVDFILLGCGITDTAPQQWYIMHCHHAP